MVVSWGEPIEPFGVAVGDGLEDVDREQAPFGVDGSERVFGAASHGLGPRHRKEDVDAEDIHGRLRFHTERPHTGFRRLTNPVVSLLQLGSTGQGGLSEMGGEGAKTAHDVLGAMGYGKHAALEDRLMKK